LCFRSIAMPWHFLHWCRYKSRCRYKSMRSTVGSRFKSKRPDPGRGANGACVSHRSAAQRRAKADVQDTTSYHDDDEIRQVEVLTQPHVTLQEEATRQDTMRVQTLRGALSHVSSHRPTTRHDAPQGMMHYKHTRALAVPTLSLSRRRHREIGDLGRLGDSAVDNVNFLRRLACHALEICALDVGHNGRAD
jgi:hypothetical protein